MKHRMRRAATSLLLAAQPAAPAPAPAEPEPAAPVRAHGGVSVNGWLRVDGTQLCNEAGEPVVLRGMSSHGIQWFPQYANARSIQNTAAWGRTCSAWRRTPARAAISAGAGR